MAIEINGALRLPGEAFVRKAKAAGATFTLLVWAFAYTYTACQAVVPGSFTGPANAQAARTWTELLFLSVSVLSGVGLSDIIPVTPIARSLVMLEMVAGVMYIALVFSRLVAVRGGKLIAAAARGVNDAWAKRL